MSNGWIKLHRQIEENELWFLEPFTKGQAWIDLLLMANHDLNVFLVRGNRVEVGRGQVARAATTFADRWRWSKGKVLAYFEYLEKMGMIDRRISNVIAIISIKNYDQYQSTEPQDEPQNVRRKSAESPQTDPNKKEKNVKNVKNEKNNAVVRIETEVLCDTISDLCRQNSLRYEVDPAALDIIVGRYAGKIRLKVEVQHCIAWLVEKGFKNVTASRVGNWFKRAQEIQKRDQLKQLEWKEAQTNPAMAERRKALKEKDPTHENSVRDFISSQSS